MTRRLLAVVGGAVVVLVLAWTFLLWQPKGAQLTAARARTTAAQSEMADLTAQLQHLQAASLRRPVLEAARDTLRAAVPEAPELAQLILQANAASSAAGVDLMSIAPTRPTAATGGLPPAMNVSVSVEGSYFSVLDFLNRLLSLPRVVVIDTISASPQGTGHAPRLTVNLTARVFSQTTGQTGAVAPAAVTPAAVAVPAPTPVVAP